MYRRIAASLLLAVAGLTACGDDDAATTTTTAAPDTTATTTAPGTTAADPTAARVAAAMALAGDYTGEWNNTTFGSSGSIAAGFVVDEAAATGTLTLDLGGNVFGSSDPDPFEVEFDLTAEGPYEGSNDLLGEFTVEVEDDGTVVLTAPAVPGLGLGLVMEATVTDGTVSGTYTIPGLAEGTFTAERA